ncbi:MAG: protein translocase SEC61 complex subunit gamma [Methanosarcinaceae archaeon]|nr:protein translocase SEC61 complex subunit gamma [Methanosarcinaceae archaeon]
MNANSIKEGFEGIVPTIRSYIRVLKLSRKPTNEEFLTIAKVSGLGIIAIGLVGFFFYFLMDILPKMV